MSAYLLLKTLHVLSAVIVFGTGIGIAWYTLRGWLSGDRQVIRWISRETVTADWLFTGSAIVALLASAVGMLTINPAWLQQTWLQLAIALTGIVFLLWLPVVYLQYRLRHQASGTGNPEIHRIMRAWCLLGAIAFPLMVAIVFLMVAKPLF
ncbi:DUF2269 family protein [Microbulbifer hainanensis]|uniref:DUF2269 family protein n=1 Tax=Microbulbifer hainanensis TaxID=2735675 RepID=UPI001866B25A|nr:DUF2269 domain-containing protein [Microbulbifer hainanensis]